MDNLNGRGRLLKAFEDVGEDGCTTIDLKGLGVVKLAIVTPLRKKGQELRLTAQLLPSKDVIVLTVPDGSDDLNYEIRPINEEDVNN